MSVWHEELAVFDLETTGLDTSTARIVTACIGIIDADGRTTLRRDWLVNPGIPIPAAATAVHGVTTERAQSEGVSPELAVSQIVDLLRQILVSGIPLVAYNAAYDLSLLHHEALRHSVAPLDAPAPIVDPLIIDRALDRYRRGKRTLEVTCGVYGVILEGAHDAGADAFAAGRVAQALARAYETELALEAAELHVRQMQWSLDQAANFQAYIREVRDPSFVTSGVWPVR